MISCDDVYKGGGELGNHLFLIGATIAAAKRSGLDYGIQANWCYRKYLRNRLPVVSDEPRIPFVEHTNLWMMTGLDTTYLCLGRLRDNMVICGFYGNEIFLKDAAPEIREAFRLSVDYEEEVQRRFNELTQGKTVCSVHVRRGTYVDHGFCVDSTYYWNAMRFVRDSCDRFLIFSDDPDYCRNLFRSDNCVVVDKGEDILDMFLMSLCHHHIVGNSTFSWWAAWLGEKEGKKILVPQPWNWAVPRLKITPDRWIGVGWEIEPGRKRAIFNEYEDEESKRLFEKETTMLANKWAAFGVHFPPTHRFAMPLKD